MMQAKAGAISGGSAASIALWVTAYDYVVGDHIIRGHSFFFCISNHTSDVFYTDWLTNEYWVSIGDAPGNIKQTGKATAEPGYLLCDGKTVGDASSGADYAGDIYRELYEYIINNFGGTYDWSNHDKINLPDMRGIFPKGAGTTSRVLGKDANGNYYAGTLGAYVTDKMQGHKHVEHGASYVGAGTHTYVTKTNVTTTSTNYATETDTDVPKTDGTNGVPRTGLATEPQSLGLTFIIKY
jgi:microcystin-dependent protein